MAEDHPPRRMKYILLRLADWASTLSFSLFSMKTQTILKTLAATGGVAATVQCSDYTTYAQSPQGHPSAGPLKLPYMRPAPACRTWNSSAVEVRWSSLVVRQELSADTDSDHGHDLTD
jgi:hypothetical protein